MMSLLHHQRLHNFPYLTCPYPQLDAWSHTLITTEYFGRCWHKNIRVFPRQLQEGACFPTCKRVPFTLLDIVVHKILGRFSYELPPGHCCTYNTWLIPVWVTGERHQRFVSQSMTKTWPKTFNFTGVCVRLRAYNYLQWYEGLHHWCKSSCYIWVKVVLN